MTNPIVPVYHNIMMLHYNGRRNPTLEYNGESRRMEHNDESAIRRAARHDDYANSNVEKANCEWDHPRRRYRWHTDRENFCSARMLIAWMRSHFRGSTAAWRANNSRSRYTDERIPASGNAKLITHSIGLARLLLASSAVFRE